MNLSRCVVSGAALLGLCVTPLAGAMTDDEQRLFDAVRNGRLDDARNLLERGVNLEVKDGAGETPLFAAAEAGQADAAKLLIEHGAHLETKANDSMLYLGMTPLAEAASNGNSAVIEVMLGHGANIEGGGTFGLTPLIVAKNTAVAKLLLDHGANIEGKDKSGRTPLIAHSEKTGDPGQVAVVKLLLDRGANIAAADDDGQTALHGAAQQGQGAVVKLLLQRGADPNVKEKDGKTAKQLALELAHQKNVTDSYSAFVDDEVARNVASMKRTDIPEDARRFFVQGNTIFKSAQSPSDIQLAIDHYRKAIDLSPGFADAWYNLSIALEKSGDLAGAMEATAYFRALEPSGTSDRAALDRTYVLEAKNEVAGKNKQDQATLELAAENIRDVVGGRKVDRFWVFKKDDNSLCNPMLTEKSCKVFDSQTNVLVGHDGSAIGAPVTVSLNENSVVLSVGTQQFCIPATTAFGLDMDWKRLGGFAFYGNKDTERINGITDCKAPPGKIAALRMSSEAWEPVKGGAKSTVNGMAALLVTKCMDANCEHADMAYYWLGK